MTQEQRGSLKLEAYSHLLQELLVMQLHQVSIASAERTHSSDFMQVNAYLSAAGFQHSITDTGHMRGVSPLLS